MLVMFPYEKHNAKRILLVDDDIDLLMLLERKLQKSNYIIESAASVPEAEYVLSLFKPDLIILDINIAGEDGRQLCWKIKHAGDNREAKVILMSGYNYTINRQLLFGADDYVAKPFQSDYLQQKMEDLLIDPMTIQELNIHAGFVQVQSNAKN